MRKLTKAEWLQIQHRTFPATAYRGVYVNAAVEWEDRFIAFYGRPGKRFLIGFFSDAETAARAYDLALLRTIGTNAITNGMLGLITRR